ncbi:hypothetical protein AB0G67_40630 [Streptomyces sp. NPDC021056]|uniref:hypothetical protein n=1 Tax=Streptomyces sp. NPDC021056 TaxID=3155012 RepID=UPI003411117E
MDYPYIRIQAQTSNEDQSLTVAVHVQSEFFPIDEAGLAQTVQQWLLDNVPQVTTTTAERREQAFPVTQLPSLP